MAGKGPPVESAKERAIALENLTVRELDQGPLGKGRGLGYKRNHHCPGLPPPLPLTTTATSCHYPSPDTTHCNSHSTTSHHFLPTTIYAHPSPVTSHHHHLLQPSTHLPPSSPTIIYSHPSPITSHHHHLPPPSTHHLPPFTPTLHPSPPTTIIYPYVSPTTTS